MSLIKVYSSVLLGLICISVSLYQASAIPTKASKVVPMDNLTKEQVIPDVIDTQPAATVGVKYQTGVQVEQGNELTPTQVKDLPKFTFAAKSDHFYTLTMVDPDAPSRKEPKFREFLHFLVANIPGDDIGKGDTLAEYIGSGPPKGTGLHRYVFLIYQQNGGKLKSEMKISKNSKTGRPSFSIRNFAKANNLGNPIAANFYQAQYDDYVPTLHAQLNQGTLEHLDDLKILKMRYKVSVYLVTIALLLATSQHLDAKWNERLFRRQSSNQEQESTTSSNQVQGQQTGATQQPPRLYPDLPQQPGAFAPGFNAHHFPPNHGPTPFVPFGMQMPTNRLNDPQFRLQPRPVMTPADRLQSQTFTSGLGRRLLSMIGIDSRSNETSSSESSQPQARAIMDETMKALRNSTVLDQLNKGVQSIYGSLSKMYNSTVQQQLDLLQDRFKKEAENSTNPWQQRMAQQVPQFFQSMAYKVGEAQDNLNRIWRQMTQAKNGTLEENPMRPQQQTAPRSFMNPFEPFIGNGPYEEGNFFNQIGRSFGFGDPNNDRQDPQHRDLGSQLMDFWHNQVQPQIGMVRGQMARVWRELTQSGAYIPDQMMRPRNNLGASRNDNTSSNFIDDILSGVDLNNPEYSLVEPKNDQQQENNSQQQPPQAGGKPTMMSQIQNRLITMQRELNQLWMGLANSIQGAMGNVRNSLNPRPRFQGPIEPMASTDNKQEVDPTENEIDGKIKDLSKLQRESDVVYDIVQKQQQAQQRPNFGDRFRNFFNNVDFGNVDANRFGESVSRFGNVVGDLWNQIPERWDNFVQNSRQRDLATVASNRLTVTSTTQKPGSSSTTSPN